MAWALLMPMPSSEVAMVWASALLTFTGVAASAGSATARQSASAASVRLIMWRSLLVVRTAGCGAWEQLAACRVDALPARAARSCRGTRSLRVGIVRPAAVFPRLIDCAFQLASGVRNGRQQGAVFHRQGLG